jgi:DNA-binding GntR family transcriptional regulator
MPERLAGADGPSSRRPMTTQQFVLDELRRGILTGDLRPGEPIRQDALAARLGVSRVPLREALKILEGEGQVEYRPRRGYLVAELSMDDLGEVYRLREILEAEAIRVAIDRITDDDLDRLTDAARDVEDAGRKSDVLAMSAANRTFHFTLIEAAGMPRLTRILRLLWDATDAYRSVYYGHETNRHRVEKEHLEIIEATRDRDADRLIRLLDDHRHAAVESLRPIVGEAGHFVTPT